MRVFREKGAGSDPWLQKETEIMTIFHFRCHTKEPGGCSTISEGENGNCNELSSTDGLQIEPSIPRLSFPIPAPVRHSLQANQVAFPGKWAIIFPSSPRCSNTPISDVMEIFAFYLNPSWLRFPPTPSPVQDLSPMETSLRRSWK